jgi:hypothetical protein
MRTLLLTGLLLLVAGCAAESDRGRDDGYTLYRSRMMSPEGGTRDEDLEWPFGRHRNESLFDAYDAWQP